MRCLTLHDFFISYIMNWIVKIEKQETLRFKITFDPLTDVFTFYGQHRINNHWIDFIVKTQQLTDPDAKSMGEIMLEMYKELVEKVKNYEELDKRMEKVKWVNITI